MLEYFRRLKKAWFKKVQECSKRLNNVTGRRLKKFQEGSRRLKKAKEGLKWFKMVHFNYTDCWKVYGARMLNIVQEGFGRFKNTWEGSRRLKKVQ